MSMWYGDTSSTALARRNHAGPMDACPGSPRKMKRVKVWPSEFGWFLWNSDFIFWRVTLSGNLTALFIDNLHIQDGDFPLLQGTARCPMIFLSVLEIPGLVDPSGYPSGEPNEKWSSKITIVFGNRTIRTIPCHGSFMTRFVSECFCADLGLLLCAPNHWRRTLDHRL